jgi:hypothetical protein
MGAFSVIAAQGIAGCPSFLLLPFFVLISLLHCRDGAAVLPRLRRRQYRGRLYRAAVERI